jgi:hypothetical protein
MFGVFHGVAGDWGDVPRAPGLARRVLPQAASALLALGTTSPYVTDTAATVGYPSYERDVGRVGAALERVGRVAHALLEVRARELSRGQDIDDMLKSCFEAAEALRPRAHEGDGPYRG